MKNKFFLNIKSLFLGNNHLLDGEVMLEKEMETPFKTIIKNFIEIKTSFISLIVFLIIFLSVLIIPIFMPLNTQFQNNSQKNLAPSFDYLNIPNSLKNNLKQVSVGSSFSIGIDNDGNFYQWGELSKKLENPPKFTAKLVQVSAGLDHVLALDESSKIYTWGNDRLNLGVIPPEVAKLKNIKKVYAGHQISLALTDDGRLYNWGNENLIKIKIPENLQGEIIDIFANKSTVFALTKEKKIEPITTSLTNISSVPSEIQGKVEKIALTENSGIALLEDGKIVIWGANDNKIQQIPQGINGNVVDVSAGFSHFCAVTNDGKVYAWGSNYYGESDALKINNAVKITSGYYQNYVKTNDGDVATFGLKGYIMGTDHFGRDIFSRILTGGRMTMTIGGIAVIIQLILGVIVGGVAGFYGGKIDNFLMRFAEVVGAIPFLPLAMILSAIIGSSIAENARIIMIMIILGVLSWPSLARLIRGQVLAEKEKEFVLSAKAMGLSEKNIIFRQIIPNVITVIIVSVTLSFASSMLTESTLSFIGFGVLEPNPTWGNMLTGCQDSTVISTYWWRWIFPALALSISTISINLIGDGLRNAIDPKSNER